MYVVYIGERFYFSLACTSKKAIKNAQVKIVVQKRALTFREELTIHMLVPSNSRSHPLLLDGKNPQ